MNRLRARFIVPIALTLCTALSCGSASHPPAPPTVPGARCSLSASQERPLIVEWAASDRMDLEALVRQGGSVVVRYTGCEMELLRNCKAAGEYKYVPGTRQDERVVMHNADELYAKMPIGAVGLEATVASGSELSVAMSVVGKYVGQESTTQLSGLQGSDCAGATHVIVGLTTGSFEMDSGASSSAGAGVGVAGGRTASEKKVLRRGGSPEACSRASSQDVEPPEGCGAFLRLELAKVACPSSLEYVEGKGCVTGWAAADAVAVTAPAGQNDPDDAPLATTMVEAAYAMLGALNGASADPKYSVEFKGHQDEYRETVAQAGLGPKPPLQLVISYIRGYSPTTNPKGGVEIEALFHVFPPGEVRWGGLHVSRSTEESGDDDTSGGLGSFGDVQPAWLTAHDHMVRSFANPNCTISPAVDSASLAAVPLTAEQRKDLNELMEGYGFDAKRCADARAAKGPWHVEESRIYAVFSDGKKGFVFFAALEPKRDKVVLYDTKVSFIGD